MCYLIADILESSHTVVPFPMADGGEHTCDTYRFHKSGISVEVPDVLDPLGNCVDTSYLSINSSTALIEASKILWLPPELHERKDPNKLTSFGLGELITHASCSFKTIYLGLGGTSTADYGKGMAAAMTHAKRSQIIPLCDGTTSISQMRGTMQRKAAESVSYDDLCLSYNEIKTLGYKVHKTIDRPFFGVAGGMLLNLPEADTPLLGASFLGKLFKLEEQVEHADLIITGEGRVDNTFEGKAPSKVVELARKHDKKLLYICGSTSPAGKDALARHGVASVLEMNPPLELNNYAAQMRYNREHTVHTLTSTLKEQVQCME
jgi:glycerate kinase